MQLHYNTNEQEFLQLLQFFKDHASQLQHEPSYPRLMTTCNQLVEQLNIHVKGRQMVLAANEHLKGLMKDNAACPQCGKDSSLAVTGEERSSFGWRHNVYKCGSCGHDFVWNVPNNPWDMVPYVEQFIVELEKTLMDPGTNDTVKAANKEALAAMKANLEKIKPIVQTSQANMAELEAREREMSEMVNKVKKHLQIEKIRLDL